MSFANNMQVALVFKMVDELTRPLNGLKGTLGGVQEKFEKLKHSASGVFDGMQRAGIASAGMGAGILAGVKHGVEAFSDLEQSAVRLQNVLGGADGMDPYFKTISDQAIKMGMTLPGSTREFYDLAAAMRRGGADSKDIANGLFEATARLKLVQDLAPEVAGEGMATTAMAFKLTGQEAIKYADIINRTANASRLKVPGFLEAMKYIGAPAKMLGLQGLEAATQVSTVMGALANTGIDPSQVGTAFEGGVSHFAKIKTRLQHTRGAMWGEAGKILQGKGIKLEFFDEKGNYSIPRMIAQFEKLKNLTQEQRLEIGTTIFGAEGARLALIGVNEYNEMARKQLGKEHLDTQIDRMTGTLLGKTKNVLGSFADVMATLFKPIGEALKPVLDKVNALLGHLFEWLKEHPRLTAVLAGSVTVLGLFATGLGVALVSGALLGKTVMGLIEGVKDLRAAWVILNPLLFGTKAIVASDGVGLITLKKATQGLIPAIWASVSALTAQAAAFAMSPIGLITMAVIALGVEIYLLCKYWDKITKWVKDRGAWINVVSVLLPVVWVSVLIIRSWDRMKSVLQSFPSWFKSTFGGAWEWVKGLFKGDIGSIRQAFGQIWNSMQSVWEHLKKAFNEIRAALKPLWSALVELGQVLKPIWDVVKPYALKVLTTVVKGLAAMIGGGLLVAIGFLLVGFYALVKAVTVVIKVCAWLIGILTKIWSFFIDLGASAYKAGIALVTGFAKGIRDAAMTPVKAIAGVVEKVRRFLPFSPAKEGPLMDLGRIRFSETLAEAIRPGPVLAKMGILAKTMAAAALLPFQPLAAALPPMPRVLQPTERVAQAVSAKLLPPIPKSGAASRLGVPTPAGVVDSHSRSPATPIHLTFNLTIHAPTGEAKDIRREVERALPEFFRQLEVYKDRAARARN